MSIGTLEAHSKLLQLESRLTKFSYLSKESLPGAADALVYKKLKQSCRILCFKSEMPQKQKYFNFHHWYNTMCQFAQPEVERWLNNNSEFNDSLIDDCLVLIEERELPLQEQKSVAVSHDLDISFQYPSQTQMRCFLKKLRNGKLGQIAQILKKGHYKLINLTSTSALIKLIGCPIKAKQQLCRCPQIRAVKIKNICICHKSILCSC